MNSGVLLDTSFFIRFLNTNDPLFNNAENYYKYFLKKDFKLFISSLSVAEYCFLGEADELPLKNLIILPFNFDHSVFAGKLAKIIHKKISSGKLLIQERKIFVNDANLFAQAHSDQRIQYFCSSDKRIEKIFISIKREAKLNFEYISLEIPYDEYFSVLRL